MPGRQNHWSTTNREGKHAPAILQWFFFFSKPRNIFSFRCLHAKPVLFTSSKKIYRWQINMKRCSTSVIREMQTQITVRYHFTLTKIYHLSTIKCVNKDVEKLESLYIAGGIVKWYGHFRKQFGSSSKMNWKPVHTKIYTIIFIVPLSIIAKK